MIHHAWKCELLIVLAGLALVRASTGRETQNPSEPQETTQKLPPPISASTVEKPTTKPLEVTYEEGQLTIIAENSTLSDVMKALRTVLGMDIDLPANVAEQRIWIHLGPGPARRVLRDLLDDTEFNYVIQASESDADGIQSVLLTPRSKSAGSEPPERAAIRRMPGTGSDAQSSADSEHPAPEPVASVDPQQAPSPASPRNRSSISAPLQGSSALRPSAPTDPDQQIQTLQSMYEQRRQIQIRQNQKAAGQN